MLAHPRSGMQKRIATSDENILKLSLFDADLPSLTGNGVVRLPRLTHVCDVDDEPKDRNIGKLS